MFLSSWPPKKDWQVVMKTQNVFWQDTNWPRWRAASAPVALAAMLSCLKKSRPTNLPHQSCSVNNSPSHFLPLYLNQCAPAAWFLWNCSHSVQKLKLQHRLFFGFRGECWATWALSSSRRAAAVHMCPQTGFPLCTLVKISEICCLALLLQILAFPNYFTHNM